MLDGMPGARGDFRLAGQAFHSPHLLRAGLNELRPGNLHTGVDILARDGTPVYAVQGGTAQVLASSGADARVRVGSFEYWHVRPLVRDGQYVRPYADVVGTILKGAGHVHLSELSGDRYLNPLRPGGRVLAPWRDSARPVLGRPRFVRGGRVLIRAFDPVVGRRRRDAGTPVLGLAGLAYRLYDERDRRGGLQWAYRGTQLPNALRRAILCARLPPGLRQVRGVSPSLSPEPRADPRPEQ
jgi:hypothetical protein